MSIATSPNQHGLTLGAAAQKMGASIPLPFFWIMFVSMACAILFYIGAYSTFGWKGVIFGTTLFAQVHFLMSYAFSFNNIKEKMRGSFAAGLGIYLLLIGLPIAFYSQLLTFVSAFWGLMMVMAYFLLHYYENIFYFWDTSAAPSSSTRTLGGYERGVLYFILSTFAFLLLLPLAQSYGYKFRHAAVRYYGVEDIAYILTAALLVLLVSYFLYRGGFSTTILKLLLVSTTAIAVLTLVASQFMNFLGILYFNIIWHLFMWHVFYVWKLWQRSASLSFFPTQPSVLPHRIFGRFLAYATSGPLPFLAVTMLFALPAVGYFAFDYDGSRQTFLFHPFYSQFAVYIWTIPHITLSFILRR